jgi:hypothetical protein
MTSLTERYLAAALRGIPDKQRTDVERELRSSIVDAIEDRVGSGEERAGAEKAVLEGLGDPTRLAAGMSGSRLYLIGPELFVEYRQLLLTLLTIIVPIVGVIQFGVAIWQGEAFLAALLAGAAGAWTVALHIAFWVTLVFALIERLDEARDAREEISGAEGRWTVDRLPALAPARVSAGETIGEVVTSLITIGFLVFLSSNSWMVDAAGESIPLFSPAWTQWLPALIGVLVLIAGLQVVVFLVGRWTWLLASVFAVLELAFAIPVVVLAWTGTLINPAFAEAVGWPELAEGSGWVMILVALGVAVVTAWEIVDAFRRARRGARSAAEPVAS